MGAEAHGIGKLGQPIHDLDHNRVLERAQRLAPFSELRIVALFQLSDKLQVPRNAIGPLETAAPFRGVIGKLPAEFVLREAGRKLGADLALVNAARLGCEDARQKPVPVDRGMPVKAAVKRWRQLAGRPRVVGGLQHMADLVGVFAVHAVKRQDRKAVLSGDGLGSVGNRCLIGRARCEDKRQPAGQTSTAQSRPHSSMPCKTKRCTRRPVLTSVV